MRKFFIIILFVVIIVALGFYYRDYIPTTRSDFEGLYYYVVSKKNVVVVPNEDMGPSSGSGISGVGSELSSESGDSVGSSLTLEPTSGDSNSASSQDNNTNENQNDISPSNPPLEKPAALPDTVNNYVPFTSQAPTGVWDKFHDEACEEASLVMAHYYLDKRDVVFSKEAEKDLQYIGSKMKSGGVADLTIEEVKADAENIYGYKNWRIIDKPGVQDMEKELSQGNIIIIPLAGREIGNPYYRSPGPLYHMLVISGYDNKKGVFITQDPGTKRGKNFEYKFNVLIKANHDFPGDENKIDQGVTKILLVVN